MSVAEDMNTYKKPPMGPFGSKREKWKKKYIMKI